MRLFITKNPVLANRFLKDPRALAELSEAKGDEPRPKAELAKHILSRITAVPSAFEIKRRKPVAVRYSHMMYNKKTRGFSRTERS